jgi:predicted nucleotidyltransferase
LAGRFFRRRQALRSHVRSLTPRFAKLARFPVVHYIAFMQRTVVITTLKRHKAELNKLGIVRLSLFGSMARDEASRKSDVDLAVTLTPSRRGLAHLERMDRIRERLSEILGCPVDVIEEPAPSARIQRAIDQDRVLAF